MRVLGAAVLLVCFGAIVCPPVDPRKEKPKASPRPPGGEQDATPIQDDVVRNYLHFQTLLSFHIAFSLDYLKKSIFFDIFF